DRRGGDVVPHRRADQRGVRAAGSGVPHRTDRNHGGHPAVLRARRRDPRAVPHPDQEDPRGGDAGLRTSRARSRRGRRDPRHSGGAMSDVNANIGISIVMSAILYGTPLVFAGVGELFAERSGVLNLGVEGMMLMGAVTAFWTSQRMGGPAWLVLVVAVLLAAVAAALMALIHAFVTITLRSNQFVSELALPHFHRHIRMSPALREC